MKFLQKLLWLEENQLRHKSKRFAYTNFAFGILALVLVFPFYYFVNEKVIYINSNIERVVAAVAREEGSSAAAKESAFILSGIPDLINTFVYIFIGTVILLACASLFSGVLYLRIYRAYNQP